jgi:quinol monooxygenase YgiN
VTVIDADAHCVTLINTFIVRPENQEELIGLLDQATERVMRVRPGFISANIHRSLDGKRVVNYAQWRSKSDFEAMLREPACREHMSKAAALAESVEPVLYQVAAVRERWPNATLPYSADIFVSL